MEIFNWIFIKDIQVVQDGMNKGGDYVSINKAGYLAIPIGALL